MGEQPYDHSLAANIVYGYPKDCDGVCFREYNPKNEFGSLKCITIEEMTGYGYGDELGCKSITARKGKLYYLE